MSRRKAEREKKLLAFKELQTAYQERRIARMLEQVKERDHELDIELETARKEVEMSK